MLRHTARGEAMPLGMYNESDGTDQMEKLDFEAFQHDYTRGYSWSCLNCCWILLVFAPLLTCLHLMASHITWAQSIAQHSHLCSLFWLVICIFRRRLFLLIGEKPLSVGCSLQATAFLVLSWHTKRPQIK